MTNTKSKTKCKIVIDPKRKNPFSGMGMSGYKGWKCLTHGAAWGNHSGKKDSKCHRADAAISKATGGTES